MQLLPSNDPAAKDVRFTLDQDFIDEYRSKKPPFGFNGLGELVYLRTYSRLKEDGTNEQWYETVQRIVEGTYSMQFRWIKASGLHWNARKAQRSAKEMYERIFTLKFTPPGRGIWAMGSPLTEKRGLWAALNNCAFVSTDNLKEDLSDPFTFLMDASMLGIGVGFDTKGAGQFVIQPQLTESRMTYEIPDTREGWVISVKLLLESYFITNSMPVDFNYSKVRAAGSPIKGFGGVSAGPEPLRELHEAIRSTLDKSVSEPISITNIVDIMNLIGKCVVAGNVRRTAEIVFGDATSTEYLDLKNYEKNPSREAFGWTSNNSVFADVGMDYSAAAERIKNNGEPGFAWLDTMQGYGRLIDPRNDIDFRVKGGNPCLEQSLESYELCCLVETYPARHESYADYERTLKYAYLYAKTVTLGRTPWSRTNAVMLRNRRIGLSQSGIVQAIAKLGIDQYREWCEAGYDAVQEYDQIYSEWFAIPRSIKTTSIKPSGSVSLLAGATPGMHFPEAKTYVRRMRISKYSDLVGPLTAAGYPIEPAFGSEETTLVVEVPVMIADQVRVASAVSMWEQLALAAFLQRHWADNQVSATITFDPETEGDQIVHALEFYQYQLKGISFLPRKPLGAYRQMPYEAITLNEYEKRILDLRELSFGQSHEEAEVERFCNNDTCTI